MRFFAVPTKGKMNMKRTNVRKLVVCSMIAALYTAVSLALAPLTFGVIQMRLSEALGLLAVLSPVGVWGVTLGCLISNAVGVALGATMPPDIIFGTLATLIAAVLSYRLRNVRIKNIPVWSAVPPILVNAVIIGLELTFFFSNGFTMEIFLINALSVGLGQIIPCAGLGLLLVYTLEKTGLDKKLFQDL